MRIQAPKHYILLSSEHAEKFDPWPGDTVTFACGKYLIGREGELVPLEDKPKESKRSVQSTISVGAN